MIREIPESRFLLRSYFLMILLVLFQSLLNLLLKALLEFDSKERERKPHQNRKMDGTRFVANVENKIPY